MKTSMATTLSIVGVLAAGGVAFAVNTSVLDTATNQFSASQALKAEIADNTAGDSGAVAAVAPAQTPSAAVETSYNIADTGVVTLSRNGGALSVANVVPATGYSFTAVNESASRIEVTFTDGAKTLKFHADIIDDRIVTSVLYEPSQPRGTGRQREHDDDDDDDDNHEEEEGDEGEEDEEGEEEDDD